MKIFLIFSIGVLVTALGCQSTASPVTEAADKDTASVTDNKSVAAADDHSENGDDEAPRITLADAKAAFDVGEAVFVDTRAAAFYANEHVKGALNISSDGFDDNYKSVSKDKKIIAYCS